VSRERGGILLVGVGGQGVVLASAIIADAALRSGFDVKQSEVHGMSQRGGVVSSHLRYGASVGSPLVEPGEADAVVAMEWNEALRALPYLRPGAPLIVNLQRIVPPGACRDRLSGRSGYPALALEALVREVGDLRACDAMGIARDLGSPKALNSVLLGILATTLPFSDGAWLQALDANVPRASVVANEQAFRAGQALRYPEATCAQAANASAAASGGAAPTVRDAPASLEIAESWCKGRACAICVRVCPEYCLAIGGRDKATVIRPEACTGCGLCELLCPDFAIVVHDTLVTR
jgi:indolepyruvate ferredoxin oxidoreductase, beta subunit